MMFKCGCKRVEDTVEGTKMVKSGFKRDEEDEDADDGGVQDTRCEGEGRGRQ